MQSCKRDEPWRTGYLATIAFLLCPLYVVFEQGMETTLAAAVFIVALQCLVMRRPVALGVSVAILFLCRLDSALFIGLPLLAWVCLQREWRLRTKAYAVLPLVVVMAADITVNLLATGHAVPISGACGILILPVKSSAPTMPDRLTRALPCAPS